MGEAGGRSWETFWVFSVRKVNNLFVLEGSDLWV